MANFFTDESDILFHFEHDHLERVADALEDGYEESKENIEAPVDAADAIDSYRRVLESMGAMAADFIEPRAEAADLEGCVLDDDGVTHLAGVTQENVDMLGQAQLMGFTLPRKYGGLNFPHYIYAIATEIISRADASLMNLFGLQGVGETIHDFATEEVKAEYLPRFSAGEVTGAMVLTEPDFGSDLQHVQVRAEEDAEGNWKLNGVKRFITNGCGHVLLVLARSEPHRHGAQGLSVFLVDKGPTVRVRRLEDKLGIHGSPTCELQFNDTPAVLIGKRKRGLVTYVAPLLNAARLGVAAQAVGIGQAALSAARDYAGLRKQFGRAIEDIAPVAEMLVDMTLRVEAARSLLYDTALFVDLARSADRHGNRREAKRMGRIAGLLTPMIKYYAGEMSIRVANDAIQVLGGSGYMRDYPVERYLRDARITTIYEGTSQLQVVAASHGVMAGIAEGRFKELAADLDGTPGAAHQPLLAQMRENLAAAVAKAKAADDSDFVDFVARPIVDLAIHIYIGYLLVAQGNVSERKAVLADRWVRQTPMLSRNVEEIIDGRDSATLTHFAAIVHGADAG